MCLCVRDLNLSRRPTISSNEVKQNENVSRFTVMVAIVVSAFANADKNKRNNVWAAIELISNAANSCEMNGDDDYANRRRFWINLLYFGHGTESIRWVRARRDCFFYRNCIHRFFRWRFICLRGERLNHLLCGLCACSCSFFFHRLRTAHNAWVIEFECMEYVAKKYYRRKSSMEQLFMN